MSNNIFGFAAEPHKEWLYSPATKDVTTGKVTCHDPSGFVGSWDMKDGGVFFEQEGGGSYCEKAAKKAGEYCSKMNSNGV